MKKIRIIGGLILVSLMITACTVPEVTTQPDGTTQTNQVPDPKGLAGLETGKAIVQVLPPNSYTTPVLGLLTVVGTLWGLVAEFKNARSKKLLTTTIKGVELGGDDKTKEAIAKVAEANDLFPLLDAAVQRVTKG